MRKKAMRRKNAQKAIKATFSNAIKQLPAPEKGGLFG
ncbi:hypothetical protein STH12_00967 [Shewanella khirikhana]|uniref:Uncharacterized protein n=1 Tax=Shewanella khirikhana TaxID=1965282 RepID=A0ABN5TTT9_9GAMM|nr:hypothetical protein STH12_00967 [Shewanella khirikhana]